MKLKANWFINKIVIYRHLKEDCIYFNFLRPRIYKEHLIKNPGKFQNTGYNPEKENIEIPVTKATLREGFYRY